MKYQEVIDYFTSVKDLCKATNLSHQAVYKWRKVKRVSMEWQLRLEKMTRGKLKADLK